MLEQIMIDFPDIETLELTDEGIYEKIEKKDNSNPKPQKVPPQITMHFVKKGHVEVNTPTEGDYLVEFLDDRKEVYSCRVKNNSYVDTFFKYYIPYTIKVTDLNTGKIIHNETIDLEGKRVVIEMGSKSLGDTLAWFPYFEEFRKEHNCELIACTYQNNLFKESYPDIKFIEPGETVENVFAWYEIGWFYKDNNIDLHRNPKEVKNQPMQKTASDILGLEFKELRPSLSFTPKDRPSIAKPYVCIAPHSTCQAKYWNNPSGWQDLVNYLDSKGYEVLLLSKEKDGKMGNKNPDGVLYPDNYELDTIMNYLYHSEFFIGIGSGLSWLAWALYKPVVLISGFSAPYTEMVQSDSVVRIGTPEGQNLVTGYFNTHKLDAADWNWFPFPELKGTDRQFEDSKSITSEMVINKIQKFINNANKP